MSRLPISKWDNVATLTDSDGQPLNFPNNTYLEVLTGDGDLSIDAVTGNICYLENTSNSSGTGRIVVPESSSYKSASAEFEYKSGKSAFKPTIKSTI